MTASVVGIVYGMADNAIHAVVAPDANGGEQSYALAPGEAMRVIARSIYDAHTSQDDLARTLGLTPSGGA